VPRFKLHRTAVRPNPNFVAGPSAFECYIHLSCVAVDAWATFILIQVLDARRVRVSATVVTVSYCLGHFYGASGDELWSCSLVNCRCRVVVCLLELEERLTMSLKSGGVPL